MDYINFFHTYILGIEKYDVEQLVQLIEKLKKSEVSKLIETRIKEFEENRKKSSEEIFKELCFCILTANFNAEKSIRIQEEISNGFLFLEKEDLEKKLRELGHRFPKARAYYIVEARKFKDKLKKIIESLKEEELREWLVENVKGLGYKEASHFLRNIGYKNFAIIDFHILDVLNKFKLVKKPKVITKKKYLEIESLLRKIAEEAKLTLAELDLYLWYLETRKVLK
ncbi:MAG: N-glycosylase/DNA lyase [Candidatus Aenigmatarchaeota archaeon]